MARLAILVLSAVLTAGLPGCSNDPEAAPRALPSASPPPSPSATPSTLAINPSPSVTASSAASAASSPSTKPVRLTGDGIDLSSGLLEFGTTFAEAEPALKAALGGPTKDTGVGSSFSNYGTCPGNKLRALEYGGGALWVLFGDVKVDGGPLTMYQWALTPKGQPTSVPRASALVGDVSTLEFGIGTTVKQLRDSAATGTLEVRDGDEVFGPSFSLMDQSSGFYGNLTNIKPTGTVTFVQGGMGCGE